MDELDLTQKERKTRTRFWKIAFLVYICYNASRQWNKYLHIQRKPQRVAFSGVFYSVKWFNLLGWLPYSSPSSHLQIQWQTTSAKVDSSHENNIFIISSPLYVFRYVYRSDIYRIVKKQKYNFHVRKKVQIKKLRRICNHRSFFICTLHYLFSIKFPIIDVEGV